MEDLNTIPIPEEVKCRCCKTVVESSDAFCPNCAYPLLGTEEEQSTFIGQYITRKNEQEEWKRQVKNAKITLIVLAILTIGYGLINFAVNSTGDDILDLVVFVVVAGIYAFLAWWSDTTPFGALLTGLIIYVALNLLMILLEPATIFSGLIWKVVIISYLIKGVVSAAKVRNLS